MSATCISAPAARSLTTTGTRVNDDATLLYRASKADCHGLRLEATVLSEGSPAPQGTALDPRRRPRYGACDRQVYGGPDVSRRLRKKVEMLFAHLKRILKLDRLRLRGPNGARDEFLLAATAQNLRKLAKLIPTPSPKPA